MAKSIQYGFNTINVLDDGTVYVVSGQCNDEKPVYSDENGESYIWIDGKKVYIENYLCKVAVTNEEEKR